MAAQPVTISSATPGATIYYTTNGTTPTTNSLSGPSGIIVTVPANTPAMTIQAFAQAAGDGPSIVESAYYETTTAVAGSAVWANFGGGSWGLPGNWLNDLIPTSGVTADFSPLTLGAATFVTLDGPQTVGNLVFGDAAAHLGN